MHGAVSDRLDRVQRLAVITVSTNDLVQPVTARVGRVDERGRDQIGDLAEPRVDPPAPRDPSTNLPRWRPGDDPSAARSLFDAAIADVFLLTVLRGATRWRPLVAAADGGTPGRACIYS